MAKILIVGGNSGIGLAAAELFTSHFHEVTSLSRSNKLDYTDESVVSDFFQKQTQFQHIIVTATTPLAIGLFKEIEIQKARLFFEKFWGIVNIVHYAANYSKHLESITLLSGAASGKRGSPFTYLAANCTAVNILAESLAVELAPIRINAVSPGVTDTPLYGKDQGNLSDFVEGDPLKRVASAKEVAEVIYFVSQHPHMTGAIVPCDGGAHLT